MPTEASELVEALTDFAKSITFTPIDLDGEITAELVDEVSDISKHLDSMKRTVALMVTRFPEGRARSIAWTKAQEMFFWMEQSVLPLPFDSNGLPLS